jgi:RNA polymerase sigma-70 factor (sigma-E family)
METVQPRRERSVTRPEHDFDAWVAARGPGLMRLAVALTGNRPDAEDLVQEALSRVLPRWERLCRLQDPDAYTKRMIVNAHVSTWRRTRRRESPVAEPPFEGSTAGADAGIFPDERRRLWVACQALPVTQRTAVVLRYYEQLEYAEIAELLGVREGTVRSRVSRAMASLRRELGEDHG